MIHNILRTARSLPLTLAILAAAPVQARTTTIGDAAAQGAWALSATEDMDAGSPGIPVITDEVDPRIYFITDEDTVFAGIEPLILLLKRETPGNRLTVTVKLEQEQQWLADRSREVTFSAGDSLVLLQIPASDFSERVTRSGTLTLTLDEVSGYETVSAKATVLVVSTDGPAVTYSLSQPSYTFSEDVGRARVELIARMAAGVPRGVTVGAFLGTRGDNVFGAQFTATPGEDYERVGGVVLMVASKYELEDGRWVGRTDVIVPLLDDDIHEGTETFELNLRPLRNQSAKAQLLNPDGSACGLQCRHLIRITDEEDRPGSVNIEAGQSSVAENAGSVRYSVTALTGGDVQPEPGFSMEVPVRTVDGSAHDEIDFTAVSTTVTFRREDFSRVEVVAGSGGYRWVASKQGEVSLVDDEVVEQEEDFSIVLDAPPASSGFVPGTASAEVVIANEDRWGFRVDVSPESIREGDEAEVTLTLRVVDKNGRVTADGHCVAEFPVTAALQFGGTASDENDYTYTVTTGDLSRVRLAGCQPSRRLTLVLQALTDDEAEDEEVVTFTPSLVNSRGVEPDPGLHRPDALRIENVAGPVRVSFSRSSYTFGEDAEDAEAVIVARAAAGATGGTAVDVAVSSRSGTATSGDDFHPVSESLTLRAQDYALENGVWVARYRLALSLLDDDVREGTESLDLILEHAADHSTDFQLSNIDGARCGDACVHQVDITDEEDIPDVDVSVDATVIGEENEASTTVTVSITNGKTFASDQVFTITFGGTATEGVDFVVTPADADLSAPGHQVLLPAGSTTVTVTITAVNDEVEDPNEEFSLSVNVGDKTVDGGVIRINNRPLGPAVEITFEGLQPTSDGHVAGIATGPFVTRFTFEEAVEGFAQEDILWQTHAGTTVDGTPIGVLIWDFTEVRAGLEYTANMMPTQNGQLYIVVKPGMATSVARGYGNQLAWGTLRIALPENRMMVAPRTLAVDEGNGDAGQFLVVLTSEPTGPVTFTVSGMEDTDVTADPATRTVRRQLWNSGVTVKVTAGKDANTVDETVTLTVSASGGGYDGRTAEVVVSVVDNGVASGADTDQTAADLFLLEDLTPETATAVLFGETDLDEAKLAALDRLGNRNGAYDLGDLLSWIDRCRRAEARCGVIPGAAAALAASGHAGRNSHRGQRNPGSGGRRPARRHGVRRVRRSRQRAGSTNRRRLSAAGYGLVLLLSASMAWACSDYDFVRPPADPDPGSLTVWLTAPADGRDSGAMLLLSGPGIDSVRAPGLELFQSGTSSAKRIIVSGALSTGPVLKFRVPDRKLLGQYRVELLQVAGEEYELRDLAAYAAGIRR